MKQLLLITSIFICSLNAQAGAHNELKNQAKQIAEQVNGQHNYHAELARELSQMAIDEISDNDIAAAKQFISMAKSHAKQAK